MVNRWTGVIVVLSLFAAFQAWGQQSEADRKFFKETLARANKGDAAAQLTMGNLYLAGTGVSRDLKKAAKWHLKAAGQGLAAAQFQVALDYAAGDGVTMDKTQAIEWFRRAADQNMLEAQVELGLCYVRGEGVSANGVEGVEWFRKAAARGSVDAEYQIGKCYLEGIGVTRDVDDALSWIRHAAQRGFPPAQNELGECYVKSIGVTKDPLQAYKWFALAAAKDDAHAVDIRVNLAKVEAMLTREQISEAQRLAHEFKPVNPPLPDVSPKAPDGQQSADVVPSAASQTAGSGIVNVSAEDDRCEIFADGAFVGHSPARLKLKDGPHLIEVKKAGFKDYRREITVTSGSDLNLRVTLEQQ